MPTDLDTREGSFIYTALVPLCFELSQAYYEFENMLDLAFLDSSYGDYLDKLVAIIGLSRNSAVKCQKTAEIVTDIDIIGEKFSCGQYIFEVLEKISDNSYIIEATDFGIEYNSIFGNLYSIMNLTDIFSAKMSENYILACEIEDDESLRERAVAQIMTKSFGGNVPDYIEKALLVDGVASVHVFTASDMGIGFVHLVISGSEKTILSEQICANCYDLFNGTDTTDGLAPIGHTVTVSTVDYTLIDIVCKIVLDDIINQDLIIENAKINVENYISSLNFSNSTVSRLKMISSIMQIDEIADVSTLTINGSSSNFELCKTYEKFEICKINSIKITV